MFFNDLGIGSAFLFPGVGYGGSCFPKDVKALQSTARASGYDSKLLAAVEAVNDSQWVRFVDKIRAHFGALSGKSFGVWGLAFKPRTDDMREAPSVPIIEQLLTEGATVQAYDPQAEEAARRIFGSKLSYVNRSYDAIKGVDALVIVTEWNEYRRPEFDRLKNLLTEPVVFDGRNIWNAEMTFKHGLEYHGIGTRSTQNGI